MQIRLFAGALMLAALCWMSVAHAEEPTVERRLYINRVPDKVAGVSLGLGPVVGALVRADEKRHRELLVNQYAIMKRTFPEFDIPGTVAAAIECLPIAGEAHRCVKPVVLEGAGDWLPVTPGKPGDVIQEVSITLDYDGMLKHGSLKYFLEMNEMTFGEAGAATQRYFKLMYWEPAPANYWTEKGAPGRLETTIRRALAEYASVANLYYAHAQPAEADATKNDFIRGLPTLATLKQQGLVKCASRGCRSPYLLQVDGRIVVMTESKPPIALFQSVPLSILQ